MIQARPLASVVIPAHNEAAVIGRLLEVLTRGAEPGDLQIVVVCNGCVDDTAAVVRSVAPGAVIEEIGTASKHAALGRGDEVASVFPRLYVDADVVIDLDSVRALAQALTHPPVLAVAPSRTLDVHGSSILVRAYHQVWERLPAVASGMYGRGVLAVNEAGFARIRSRPDVFGDDLFLHHAFTEHERRIVPDAVARVTVPRTVRALVRRRVRAAMGNVEMAAARGGATDTTRGSQREVMRMALHDPSLALRTPVFIGVTLLARMRASRALRRGGRRIWLRDETSRSHSGT